MSGQIQLKDFRAAGNGSTVLCYHSAGDTWICGDAGGSVHTLTKDNIASDITAGDSPITSMALSPTGDLCAISSDRQLAIHEFPDVEIVKLKYALRTDLDITHAAYEKGGAHIFVSSRGPDVDIYSCENANTEMKLRTQNSGVRTFAISDDSSLICIADDSSAILIYSLKSSESALGKSFVGSDLESRVVDITSTSVVRDCFEIGFKLSWLPHKSVLAVAVPSSKGITTIFYRKGGKEQCGSDSSVVWEEVFLTTSSSSRLTHGSEDMNIASFSPNGRYLATADRTGVILIWDVLNLDADSTAVTSDTFAPISSFSCQTATPLFDLVWGGNDGDNYIMMATPSASGVVNDVIDIKSGRCPPTGAVKVAPKGDKNQQEADAVATKGKSYAEYRSETAAFPAASMASRTTKAVLKSSSSTAETGKLRLLKKVSATVVDDDDDLPDESEPMSKAPRGRDLEDSDADNDMDEGVEEVVSNEAAIANIIRLAEGRDAPPPRMTESNLASIAAMVAERAKSEKALVQPPFQPSSTTYDEKRRRFMVWNSIGNITCSDLGTSNRIEIRFTSTERNKPEAFNDSYGFTMAALSYEGAIFASDPDEEEEGGDPLSRTKGSTVFYHAFPGQQHLRGANEKFTVTLNASEAALAVAVGEGWAAVATSSGLLRVFSSTGIPLALLTLKGPVITLCGYLHQLAVYYHDNGKVMVEVMEISSGDNMRKSTLVTSVPLSPKAHLSWVGFSVTSRTHVTIDSSGIARMLLCSLGWQWTPILDLNLAKRTPDHTLWPVTVKGNRLSHVLLNGESRPATYPLPVTAMKTFKMPITETREGKDRGAAQNDRMHLLLWDSGMAAHFEAIKDQESSSGTLPEGLTSEDLEKKLFEQQESCDKIVLTLFQLACQQQRTEQALDYAHRIRLDHSLQSAVQIANHFGRTAVAAAVDTLLTARQELAEEQAWQQQQQEEGGRVEEADRYEERENADPVEQERNQNTISSSSSSGGGGISRRGKTVRDDEDNHSSQTSFEPEECVMARPQPVNPFARQGSPPKRKSLLESMRDLKGSPSPKKATLSRTSSFSQNARSTVSKTKNFL